MRRLTRFSLRALLLVITVVCCLLAVHVSRQRAAERQRGAVAAVSAAQGMVRYDYEQAAGHVWDYHPYPLWHWDESPLPTYPREAPVPPWLLDQFGIDYFCTVRVVHVGRGSYLGEPGPKEIAEIDRRNADLAPQLAELDDLECVCLYGYVPPATLDSLDELPRLRRVLAHKSIEAEHLQRVAASMASDVELYGEVTDAQLRALCQSQHVRRLMLGLHPASFSDAGVIAIGQMQQLTSLTLASDQATDAAALPLARLRNLLELHVRLPRMTTGLPQTLAGKPLRILSISHMPLDAAAFRAIGDLQQLHTVCIHRPQLPGEPPSLANFKRDTSAFDRLLVDLAKPHSRSLPPEALAQLTRLKLLRRLRLDFELSAADIRALLRAAPLEILVLGSDISKSDGQSITREFPQVKLRFEDLGVNQFCSGTYEEGGGATP